MRYNNTAEDRNYFDAQDGALGDLESTGGIDRLAYARILRTIGHALESFRVVDCDITLENDVCTVKGRAIPIQNAPRGWLEQMRDFFHKNRPSTLADMGTDRIHLRYTMAEIRSMEAHGRQCRSATSDSPDPLSLSQLLRVIGAFMDKRNGEELLGVWIDDRWVTINHVSRNNQLLKTTHDIEYFYDLWVKMYLKRSGRLRPLTLGGATICRAGEYLAPTLRRFR